MRAIFIFDTYNQELVGSITMPNHSSSKALISSLRRVPAICAVIAFSVCQIACLSHFHCLELSHLDHHHHATFGCIADHKDEHDHTDCDDGKCSFTDIHDHSSFDYTITPTRPELWWPEIDIVGVETPVSMASSWKPERSLIVSPRSLVDRLGFTFIGRSPTAS